MDFDLDPLIIDHPIQTVEIDDSEILNPSILSYDGQLDRPSSITPASSQILPHSTAVLLDHSKFVQRSTFSPTSEQSRTNDESLSPAFTSHEIYLKQAAVVPVTIPPPRYQWLPYATSRTGVVYDVRMLLHRHLKDSHPEQPARISAVWQILQDGGLMAKPDEEENEYHLIRLPIRPASKDEICLVHTRDHYEWVQELPLASLGELKIQTERLEELHSIYVHPNTLVASLMAAGGAIDVTKAVVAGLIRNAIAVIRPPGHHAEHDHASGFCFFNNVAVAAKVVQREYPDLCRKILILDWDVHHGNGIQHTFENDPNVLYISLHVHEGGNFYPHGPDGDHLHCGIGKGLGRNINIPWVNKGMGDADYIYAFQQVVMPVAIEFDPDLVMISAGFDAADGDALGGCFISPAGYSHMTHMLMQLARGKVVACLEGGYGFESMGMFNPGPVAKSALAVTRTLMGEPPERLGELTLHQTAIKIVRTVLRVQSRYWQSLYPKDLDIQRKTRLGSERLHDIIREWQSKRLWSEHKMSALFIMRETISKSFENQVLATPNYNEARPLLVIFHDPPEALGFPDPRSSQLELHNTWLTDLSKSYVDWAVKHDFAVIDVNIPKHLTGTKDDLGYEETTTEQERAKATLDVASYLWCNYIEPGDSTHIFLLGIGDAYVGIVELLTRYDTASESVTHSFSFLADNALRRVDRPSDEGTVNANRYYRRSSIFISPQYQAWDVTTKKLSKKFGRLIKSSEISLQEMLLVHRPEVAEKLLELTQDFRAGRAANPARQMRENMQMLQPLADVANGHVVLPVAGMVRGDLDVLMGDGTVE